MKDTTPEERKSFVEYALQLALIPINLGLHKEGDLLGENAEKEFTGVSVDENGAVFAMFEFQWGDTWETRKVEIDPQMSLDYAQSYYANVKKGRDEWKIAESIRKQAEDDKLKRDADWNTLRTLADKYGFHISPNKS